MRSCSNANEDQMECWSVGVLECCKPALLLACITPSLQDSITPPLLVSWTRKHLLDIESLTAEELLTVLDTARAFKEVGERAIKKVPALRGKTVVNLFIEPSTRTRISFELSEQRLSADIINFTAEASSLKKGETLKDTVRNLELS